MFKVKDSTFVIGVTELRSGIPKEIEPLTDQDVVLTKRGKPWAVLIPFAKYQRMDDMLDEFEDLILGHIAKKRHSQHDATYLSHDQVKQLLSKKKK